MTRVILNGCNGKMGQSISKLADNFQNVKIVVGIDSFENVTNIYPTFRNIEDCNVSADVIIDFSRPDALSSVVDYARSKKLALIVATTGLDSEQNQLLNELSKEVPVLVSSNMSLGMNLLIDLVTKAAKILEENYDIEIIEKHHNSKVDAPSGSAYMIADAINTALAQKKQYVYERESKKEKREKSELGIHSIRGGTIVGEHSVIFAGLNEVLEINHLAYSRDIFANGALVAANFLATREPGLYDMKDLIELS